MSGEDVGTRSAPPRTCRRDLIKAASAGVLLGLGGCATLPPQAARPLGAVAAAKGFRFGTAVNLRTAGGATGALIARECGILVAENEFKFGFIRNTADAYRLGPADQLMGWATARRIPMRGHNLYWNTVEYTPKWLADRDFGAQPAIELEKLLVDHIDLMTGRYPAITSWDVINETVLPETGAWRPTVATRILGDRLMDVTYAAARRNAPGRELVYNDFMGWNPSDEKHRTGVLRTLEGMRRRGVPCDALGLQSHLQVPSGDLGPELARRQAIWRGFLNEVTGMGYRLLITELDVDDRQAAGDIARRDQMVADTTRAYLDVTLAVSDLRDILVWGLDHPNSWLQGYLPRPDKLPQRGSPFDADLRPTPMYDAILAAIEAAPVRT